MMPEWFLGGEEDVRAYMDRTDEQQFAAVDAEGDLLLVFLSVDGEVWAQGVPIEEEGAGAIEVVDRRSEPIEALATFPLAVLALSEPETWDAMKGGRQ